MHALFLAYRRRSATPPPGRPPACPSARWPTRPPARPPPPAAHDPLPPAGRPAADPCDRHRSLRPASWRPCRRPAAAHRPPARRPVARPPGGRPDSTRLLVGPSADPSARSAARHSGRSAGSSARLSVSSPTDPSARRPGATRRPVRRAAFRPPACWPARRFARSASDPLPPSNVGRPVIDRTLRA